MLEKTYNAAEIEPRIRELWDEAGAFKAGAGSPAGADPYCIVIPPPNVTGSLHMGHALNNTLQDVLIRFKRMRGCDVLWQPGMDHAGIATQMVVERQMMEAQEPDRRTIGRQAFLEKVWRWKDESGGTIVNQLKRLGASCDWSRERFTMDEGLSAAVVKVFVALHKQGLIYKDKRLVNWDPKLHTAISDLEVQQVETNGHLWHFRYPIEGEAERFITVATTRPETMLGDTAVAVHPDDERYMDLVGKNAVLPLVGRLIPIVADDYADPEAGSGAVKITPAHDFNDFEVGKCHDLALVNVMDGQANIVLKDNPEFAEGVPASADLASTIEALDGLDRFAARQRVVAIMDERGLLEKVEDHAHTVPHGDRSGVPIEPFLTDQWYVDAKTLAGPAIASVREGRTVFVPKSWENTYFNWMENIQPWCISRQLWWGHRIPAWYGPRADETGGLAFTTTTRPEVTVIEKPFVAENEAEAIRQAEEFYGRGVMVVESFEQYQPRAFDALHDREAPVPIFRDPDVLDTWFSSALWPFSTLGWPDGTPELARYYPTSVLVTGFDIIFFWVARMMMFGLHFMDREPFPEIYIHGIVRDEHGAKMSKSKGNVVDPLELIDEFGADALRFTMAALATPGRDVKPARSRIEGSRNFGTKLWNAARFCEMNECRPAAGFDPVSAKLTVNRWILTEAARATDKIAAGIESYRFDDAAGAVYQFVWNTFCDWYLELIKPILNGGDEAAAAETRATAAHVLAGIFKVLHPFMPFMTEALWEDLSGSGEGVLALERWPQADFADAGAAGEINWLVELIGGVRSVRAEMNVPARARTDLVVVGASEQTRSRLDRNKTAIGVLARVDDIRLETQVPAGSAQILVGEAIVALPLAGIIDFGAERARLEKEIARIEGEISRLDKKLGNEKFIAKAPEAVVQAERDKRGNYAGDREKLEAALKRLQDAA